MFCGQRFGQIYVLMMIGNKQHTKNEIGFYVRETMGDV